MLSSTNKIFVENDIHDFNENAERAEDSDRESSDLRMICMSFQIFSNSK